MNSSKLTTAIRNALAGGRKALIPFLPGGYPTRELFWKHIAELDASGADIIEIGIPFSDPVADGPTVERASLVSLDNGVTLAWIIEELASRRDQFKAQFVLMGYTNPFYQYGFARLAEDAARAGVGGFIVPDLPLDESGELQELLNAQGVDLVHLIGLNTSRERMQAYAKRASGFVYFVSVLGITGARESLPTLITSKLKEAREVFETPLALGFGIKTPEQIDPFADSMDGVVFGSALIDHIDAGKSPADFMKRFTAS